MAVPDSPVTIMAAPPLVRVTADHLALIQALLNAGQTARAMELLDSVWHPSSPEEQCWYLRLWVLTAEGRTGEALDLARMAARELPSSIAVACLQTALEVAHGTPAGAFEAGERARVLAREHQVPAPLVALLASTADDGASSDDHPRSGPVAGQAPAAPLPSPLLAAELAAPLLYPLGSPRPLLPTPSARRSGEVPARSERPNYRRFSLLAAGTVVAALWAIHDPIPAFLTLAAMVVLLIGTTRR